MADKSAIELLRGILADNTWHSWNWEWMKSPFRTGGFVCVTDGHLFVAIKDEQAAAPELVGLSKGSMLVLNDILSAILSGPQFDVAHLKAWSDRAKPACNICNGSGKQSCDVCNRKGCYACDMYGEVECSCHYAIPAELFGKCVNILLVHRVVAPFSGTFQIGGSTSKDTPLVFGGDNWKAAIMPMRLSPEEVYKPLKAERVSA